MYDPISRTLNDYVMVEQERYTELIRKEERLSILCRQLKANDYVSTSDIKSILDYEETENGNG